MISKLYDFIVKYSVEVGDVGHYEEIKLEFWKILGAILLKF